MRFKIMAVSALSTILCLSLVSTAAAATKTWNNGSADFLWNTTSVNWTGATYTNAVDDVLFAGAGPGSITIQNGGVSPTGMSFTGGNYTFNPTGAPALVIGGGGPYSQTAGLVAFRSSRVAVADPAPFTFSGGSTISGAATRLDVHATANSGGNLLAETLSWGTGSISLDNGATLRIVKNSNDGSSVTNTLTNNILIGSGGGKLMGERTGGSNGSYDYTGSLTLGGNITTDQGGGSGRMIISGSVTLTNNVQWLGQSNERYADTEILGNVTGAAFNLTVPGELSLGSGSTSGTISLASILVPNGGVINVNQALTTSNPFNTTVATNGGTVTFQSGSELGLTRGKIDLNQVTLGSNMTINLRPTSANSVDFTASPTMTVSNGQLLNFNAEGQQNQQVVLNITVGNNGTLRTGAAQNSVSRMDGNLTLLNGSTWRMSHQHGSESGGLEFMNKTLNFLTFGDGTASTITVTGGNFLPTDAPVTYIRTGVGANSHVNVLANTTIRYGNDADDRFMNLAFTSNSVGNGSPMAVTYQLPAGTAATEFAPKVDASPDATLEGFRAIGPSSGAVFTTSTPTRLITAGRVEFWNSSSTGSVGFINTGTAAFGPVVLNSGGTFDLQAAGRVVASTLTVNTGASISGIGTFQANVTANGGTISPGNSPGILTIDGNLTMQNDSTLAIQLGGLIVGTGYDRLVVTGAVNLADADLDVSFINGFQPGAGVFTILTGTSVVGTFDNIVNGVVFTTDGLGMFLVNFTGDSVILSNFTHVPEPSSLALLGLGVVGMAIKARRRTAAA